MISLKTRDDLIRCMLGMDYLIFSGIFSTPIYKLMFFYSFLELQAGPREPARSRLIPKARDDLVGCTICGRNFAEDRIEKHQEICMKSQSKKRKTFDMAKKRLQGTDAETFALKPKRGGARVSKVSPQIIPSFSNYLTDFVPFSSIFAANF